MQILYHMPVRIIFGRESVKNHKEIFSAFGKTALIVTGRNSSKINGSLRDVCAVLDGSGVRYEIFDTVDPNPSIENITDGARIARRLKAEYIIGIGGGSPLDASKAIALLTHNDLSGDEIFSGRYSGRIIPNIAVPTTAGTGSEVTQYAIITDRSKNRKRNLSNENNFPRYAVLDPAYTETLPATVTVNTAIDALSHAVEGYLSRRANTLSDRPAEEALRILGQELPSLSGALTCGQREQLLYASMLAGMVIAQTGTTAVHGMGYALTLFRGIDHGRANGYLMSAYLDYVSTGQREKVEGIYSSMNLSGHDEFKGLIDRLLGEKEDFTWDEIREFTDRSVTEGSIRHTDPVPGKDDIMDIYRKSLC